MFFIGVHTENADCWQSKFEACRYSNKLINKITLWNKKTNNGILRNRTNFAHGLLANNLVVVYFN